MCAIGLFLNRQSRQGWERDSKSGICRDPLPRQQRTEVLKKVEVTYLHEKMQIIKRTHPPGTISEKQGSAL